MKATIRSAQMQEVLEQQRRARKQIADQLSQDGLSISTYHPKTLAEAFLLKGHDMDFEPACEAVPTEIPPGTRERIEILRMRIERGEELFAEGDATLLPSSADIAMRRDWQEPALPGSDEMVPYCDS